MSTARISRNAPCRCGSGKKFKHCCYANPIHNTVPQPRPVPTDGAFLRREPEPPRAAPQPKSITRVAVEYCITDTTGKAEVTFCYPLGTQIMMADGNVLLVEWLQPGMQFRLEDGGVATTTTVKEPKVWEPPSLERDANGRSLRRVLGRVKYSGYYPRMDFGVPGDVIETTPGHLFYSMTRGGWFPLETFRPGEWMRNDQGISVKRSRRRQTLELPANGCAMTKEYPCPSSGSVLCAGSLATYIISRLKNTTPISLAAVPPAASGRITAWGWVARFRGQLAWVILAATAPSAQR